MAEWDEWEHRVPNRQDTRDPDYFEGPDEGDFDEDREIEARQRVYENWLGRT